MTGLTSRISEPYISQNCRITVVHMLVCVMSHMLICMSECMFICCAVVFCITAAASLLLGALACLLSCVPLATTPPGSPRPSGHNTYASPQSIMCWYMHAHNNAIARTCNHAVMSHHHHSDTQNRHYILVFVITHAPTVLHVSICVHVQTCIHAFSYACCPASSMTASCAHDIGYVVNSWGA